MTFARKDSNHKPCYGNWMLPDEAARLLRSCRDLYRGRQIHRQIIEAVAPSNVFLDNLLVDMYGRCGSPGEAGRAFAAIAHRNSFSWGILMAAYARSGDLGECEAVFYSMPARDVITWNTMITAYGQAGFVSRSREVFYQMPERNLVSWNAIAAVLAQGGNSGGARQIFDKMPTRDIVSWNTIASILMDSSTHKWRDFFDSMPNRNEISWSSVIQSVSQGGDARCARDLLERMPHWGIFACNALIATTDTAIDEAQELFDQMPHRDVATWTALMDAYGRAGFSCQSRRVFAEMPVRNIFSWTVLIGAVARAGTDGIQEIFARMPATNLVAWNATIAAFAEHLGHLSAAWRLFLSSPCRDVTTWNIFVHGFGQAEPIGRSKEIFFKMPQHGLVAWNSMLIAFTHSGHLDKGYSLFRAMPDKDRFSWSAALSWNHRHFWEMILDGIEPDPVCMTSLLASLKDAGDLHSARDWFVAMLPDFGLQPSKNHIYCIADALGKSGESILAFELLERIPFDHDAVAWTAILTSCVESSNFDLGKYAAERVLYGDDRDLGNNDHASAYISLANSYSMIITFD